MCYYIIYNTNMCVLIQYNLFSPYNVTCMYVISGITNGIE